LNELKENVGEVLIDRFLTGEQVLALAQKTFGNEGGTDPNLSLSISFQVVGESQGFNKGDLLVIEASDETVWFDINGTLYEEAPGTFVSRTQGVLFTLLPALPPSFVKLEGPYPDAIEGEEFPYWVVTVFDERESEIGKGKIFFNLEAAGEYAVEKARALRVEFIDEGTCD
jgi:hypothetical protein